MAHIYVRTWSVLQQPERDTASSAGEARGARVEAEGSVTIEARLSGEVGDAEDSDGRGSGVLAVCDEGFFRKMQTIAAKENASPEK